MGERIALVINALAGEELTGGKQDTSRVHSVLIDPELGACSDKLSPPPLYDCDASEKFSNFYRAALASLKPDDQLVFYFSGHGRVVNHRFVLQVGMESKDIIPFESLAIEFDVHNNSRGIFIVDACYSGSIAGEKALAEPVTSIDAKNLPPGVAVLASSRSFESSFEKVDGSGSVFTYLLCEGIRTGLDDHPTPGGVITIEQIAEYINRKLQTPEYRKYRQTFQYRIYGGEIPIWLARNRTGATSDISKKLKRGIRSESQLKVLFDKTPPSQLPCYEVGLDQLDRNLVETFAKSESEQHQPGMDVIDLAELLGLFSSATHPDDPALHRAAVLCFCRNPSLSVPQAEIVLTIGNPGDPHFVHRDIGGPLSEQIKQTHELVMEQLGLVSVIDRSATRQETKELPSDLVREVIANAVVHRDYALDAPVQIRLRPRVLEIQSPGRFPSGITWENLIRRNLGSHPVDARIVYYLVRLGVLERSGRGFELIREFLRERSDSTPIECDVLPNPAILIRVHRIAAHGPRRGGPEATEKEEAPYVESVPVGVGSRGGNRRSWWSCA